jgi:hypothetical protein
LPKKQANRLRGLHAQIVQNGKGFSLLGFVNAELVHGGAGHSGSAFKYGFVVGLIKIVVYLCGHCAGIVVFL